MEVIGDYMVFDGTIIDCRAILIIDRRPGYVRFELDKGGHVYTRDFTGIDYKEIKQKFLTWAKKGVKE